MALNKISTEPVLTLFCFIERTDAFGTNPGTDTVYTFALEVHHLATLGCYVGVTAIIDYLRSSATAITYMCHRIDITCVAE